MLIKIDKMNVPDSLSKIDLLIFPIYMQSIESQLPRSPGFISLQYESRYKNVFSWIGGQAFASYPPYFR